VSHGNVLPGACATCSRALNCLGAWRAELTGDCGARFCSPNCKWSAVLGGGGRRKKHRKGGSGRVRVRRSRTRVGMDVGEFEEELRGVPGVGCGSDGETTASDTVDPLFPFD
jgi:hypothetical protein